MLALLSRILRLFCILAPALAAAQELQRLDGCRFVPTAWADGDSFLVRTADGAEHTVRLYGVDCVEYHVTDKTDADRLREQRRYFGIAEAGGSPQTSIALAKEAGRLAAEETSRALSHPFTLHTAFADARGDGKYKRIYAFVTTAGGDDLGERLVGKGLARAFGVYREGPDGSHRDTYREKLRDLELRAARLGRGVWAGTDWEKLPAERQLQRDEDAETGLATGAKRAAADKPVDLNTAARDELMTLPGIGEIMANRIIEGRPYGAVGELGKIPGIGTKTLEELRPYVTASQR